MAKTKYDKNVKRKVQEILASGKTKAILDAELADQNLEASDVIAHVMVIRAMADTKYMEVLLKLSGDMTEEIRVESNSFTELIKNVTGESEF